jgi:hypothetical protein
MTAFLFRLKFSVGMLSHHVTVISFTLAVMLAAGDSTLKEHGTL